MVVKQHTALKLRALRDFTDSDGNQHIAGDEYLFEGPGQSGCFTFTVICSLVIFCFCTGQTDTVLGFVYSD